VLSTCGLFLIQAAPFVMAGTVIIYAGAIVVTFLFVIMLSQQGKPTDADDRSREPLLACVAGGLLLFLLSWSILGQYDTAGFDRLLAAVDRAAAKDRPNLDEVRDAVNGLSARSPARTAIASEFVNLESELTGPNVTAEQGKLSVAKFREMLAAVAERRVAGDLRPAAGTPLSAFGGPPPSPEGVPQSLPAANVAGLGRLLFSDYILAVEMAGTLLLVSTIGAIAISHRSARRAAA
jgi:NADH:ubiquinone oxidoreductase subunit 6 (subunit J)